MLDGGWCASIGRDRTCGIAPADDLLTSRSGRRQAQAEGDACICGRFTIKRSIIA
jgi:hypothetical protein